MDIQALGMLSNITAIEQKQNVNTIEGDINVEKDFYGTLREQQINCVKEDIYNKFHIDVGAANGYFECYIPSDVLYKMNTDTALRQKVYDMLADYSSDKFKLTMQTLNPPVKKCTLVFDDNGEIVATLEPDVGGEKAISERSKNTEKVRIMNASDIKSLLQNDMQDMIKKIEVQGVMAMEYKKKSIYK